MKYDNIKALPVEDIWHILKTANTIILLDQVGKLEPKLPVFPERTRTIAEHVYMTYHNTNTQRVKVRNLLTNEDDDRLQFLRGLKIEFSDRAQKLRKATKAKDVAPHDAILWNGQARAYEEVCEYIDGLFPDVEI